MATENETHLSSEHLLQRLGSWKFIAASNQEAFEKNPVLLEFLGFEMDAALSFIEELQVWEKVGDQSKCDYAVENTQVFLEKIQVLIDCALDEQEEEALLYRPGKHRSIPYVFSSNESVLKNAILYLPHAV